MLTRTAIGLALVVATASGSLAATRHPTPAPAAPAAQNVYNPYGANIGSDPDRNIRFNLQRDWTHGRY
jgi:hypothetical protein